MSDSIKTSLSEIEAMEEARIRDAEAEQRAFKAAVEAHRVQVELAEQERLRQIAFEEKAEQEREIERLRLVAKIESYREKNYLKIIEELTSKSHEQRLQLAVMDAAPPKTQSIVLPLLLATLLGFAGAAGGARLQKRADISLLSDAAASHERTVADLKTEISARDKEISELRRELESSASSCDYPPHSQTVQPAPKSIPKTAPKPTAPCVCPPGDPLCACL